MRVLVFGGNSQIFTAWLRFTSVFRSEDFFYFSREKRGDELGGNWLGPMSSQAPEDHYDLVVNFIGESDPRSISKENTSLYEAMELSDLQATELARRGAHYIYISSGAVHRSLPSRGGRVEPWAADSPYTREKLRAEASHDLSLNPISDLRVFGYVGGSKSLAPATLLGDLFDAWVAEKPFRTGPSKVFRDFAGPIEVAQALDVLSENSPHGPFDLYSSGHCEKSQLAEALDVPLEIQFEEGEFLSPTGAKSEYFSKDQRLSEFGYFPTRSALQIVLEEFLSLRDVRREG